MFRQVAVRRSPLETRTLCEALLRDSSDASHARSGRIGGRTSRLPELRRACRLRLPHPRREDRREVPHPRFVLVPALREELEVPVPADRRPGRAWKQGPALTVVPAPHTERPVRIRYARTSTARQELASQLEALHRA